MPSALPEGDAPPLDGALDARALATLPTSALGVYVHVPFCSVRCGYCDFNTYTPSELDGPDAVRGFVDAALAEVRLAGRVLGADRPPASTVFFGGGTPTWLDAADLARLLDAVRNEVGVADGAEVTTEANPDSVGPRELEALAAAGFTRVSFGMQSAVPRVLATLDRTHDPDRVPDVVDWARRAGMEQVSLDLIYGTPGESLADWRRSLDAVLACGVDHVSAYALVVEPGTPLARQVRRGEVVPPDDDDLADKYVLADEVLGGAGLRWYEVSNWARTGDPAAPCRHNLGYWRGHAWWGVGPGSHSHAGGTRWWNVKHPRAYADRLAAGLSPAHAREVLDEHDRATERVLLEVRLAEGMTADALVPFGTAGAVRGLVARGLVEPGAWEQGRLVLTRDGRLLADGVVRELVA